MLQLVPNVITSLRLLLAIPICIFIYQGNELLALLLFIFAGISDGFDGYLARSYGWESEFGKLNSLIKLRTFLPLTFFQLINPSFSFLSGWQSFLISSRK